jgi:hypothetical protein
MNKSIKLVAVMVTGVSLLGLGAYASADGKKSLDAAAISQLPVSQDQAVTIALQSVPGTVLGTEFDQRKEAMLWEIEIIDGTGKYIDVEVDAHTGAILASKAADANDKKDDGDRQENGDDNDHEGNEGSNDQDQDNN